MLFKFQVVQSLPTDYTDWHGWENILPFICVGICHVLLERTAGIVEKNPDKCVCPDFLPQCQNLKRGGKFHPCNLWVIIWPDDLKWRSIPLSQ